MKQKKVYTIQRVLALCDFWDLEKVALAKIALGRKDLACQSHKLRLLFSHNVVAARAHQCSLGQV